MAILVYQNYTDLGLSTLLTLTVGIQCFGYLCLRVKISQQRSVAGISGRSLILQALSYILRLSSTTWLKGYIPVDETGDWLYQLLDVFALLMVLQILYCVFKSHRHTYQEECDAFSVQGITISCFILAVIVHPDLNDRPLFDTLWATSLYIDVVAMAPQLWMMSKSGGAESVTSHYVFAIALSRAVNLVFWYYGYAELAPEDGGANIAGYAILAAHVLQILLMADFVVLYIKSGCNR